MKGPEHEQKRDLKLGGCDPRMIVDFSIVIGNAYLINHMSFVIDSCFHADGTEEELIVSAGVWTSPKLEGQRRFFFAA